MVVKGAPEYWEKIPRKYSAPKELINYIYLLCSWTMSQEKSGESGLGFDDVLDQVNPFGPYQWRTWFIGAVFEVPMAFCIMFFVFGGANPGWKCAQVAGNE